MAVVTIITKNNDIAGVVPSPGNLVEGELAVNTTDRKLYTLDNGGNVVLLASGTAYDDPITVDVNSASTAVTITQTGAGGGLRVTNTGAGNSLLIEDAANPDSTPFVVNADGNLVLGSTTVANTTISGTPNFSQGGVTATSARNAFSRWDATASGFAMQFGKSRGGALGTFGVVSQDDSVGQIQFFGSDPSAFVQLATIGANVDGTPGAGDMPGRLVFSTTADGASTPTERYRITSTGALAIAGAANYGAAGQALVSAGNAAPVWTDQFISITYVFQDPVTASQGDLTIPFNCTITEWTILGNTTGSIVIDIWKDTYANYPPTVADTITGSAKPTISAAEKAQSSTLTGWTTTINAGDTLRFYVDSASTLTRATISLKVKRT